MAEHNETGKKGENFAIQMLQQKQYKILAANWRYRRCEIDIIATKDGVLVFVEVKSRKNLSYGSPALFVSERKEHLIMEAAAVYMETQNMYGPYRFDIIAVEMYKDGTLTIDHFEDAFGGEE